MKWPDKLDALQEMSKACDGDPRKSYLISLLVELAEEEECTEELLAWVKEILLVTC